MERDEQGSFAGNLTDDPEVRYTEGGIARAMFRVAVSIRLRSLTIVGTADNRLSPSSRCYHPV
jgi:single-stranded DNA-binding protein